MDNVHPGDVLRLDFLMGDDIAVADVARHAGIDPAHLQRIIDHAAPIDANTDLRLARYFGMSEGFFLRLQLEYDLEQERRTHGAEIDRISRRAA